MKKKYLYAGVVVLLGLIIYLSLQPPRLSLRQPPPKKTPDFSFQKVKITQYTMGKRQWEVHSDTALWTQSVNSAWLYGVKTTVYETNRPRAVLQAPTANLKLDTPLITFYHPKATILFPSPLEIDADTLEWNPDHQKLTGVSPVIRYQTLHLRSAAVTALLSEQRVILSGRSTAVIRR